MSINIKKILLVEDSLAIQAAIKLAIKNQLNLDVVTARTITETRRILQKSRAEFFLAILDLNLPDSPEGSVVDLVLLSGIPAVILTSKADDITREYMMKKPIVDYIIKKRMHEIQYLVDGIKRILGNTKRTVLVVDDSSTFRSLIRNLLERQFLTVIEASDGIEALKALEENKYVNLVITDYNMPNMDGEEFIVKAREMYSRNELSIIGVSASDESAISIKLLKAGANDFLTKPFSHEEFFCRINHSIDAIESINTLRESAITDFLTGLFNRKYLFDSGYKFFENAKRENINISVAVLDVDYFKNINDVHGHNVGDMALKHIARIINQQVRVSDLLARVGGEEFCIVSINHGDSVTFSFLDRIRLLMTENPLIYNETPIELSVSIGFTTVVMNNFEEMLNDAYKALYLAKNSGRNRVVQFSI